MRFKVPPRERLPPPERSPVELMVTDELASCAFVIVPERRFAPIEVVAVGLPLLSKAKMLEAAPLRRFQPIVVEAMTPPEESPARRDEMGTFRRFDPIVVDAETTPFMSVPRSPPRIPEIVRFVVEAVPKNPVPETVSAVELAYGSVEAVVEVAKT